ncbi:MAG: Hpt domain-containing protein, partial [Burkholderiaceae bacterium]|nr:Hpt domain-containing protein [Burkholderiaceae bacterium]
MDQLQDVGGAVAGTGDLGPLAWVLEETRRSIETATRSVRRFVREAEAARGVDMASLDAGPLRMARQQLRQVVGALDMVGQSVAAQMVRAMEGAVHQFIQRSDRCTEPAAATMERAGFALLEYLEGQLGGRPRSPIGLFPQYRQVQEQAGVARIHPADLWPQPWRWIDPATPASPQRLNYDPEVRARLDRNVLQFMRDADVNAVAELGEISLGLAGGASARQPVVFWKLAAGFFEAVAQALVPEDVYVKRAASRILLQYAALAQGEQSVPERLALELLFFCAQAQPAADVPAPALTAIRAAWNLDGYQPVDYNEPAFGLFDPAVLAQARRRIESIKESWSALTGGDLTRKRSTVDQFGLVAESLLKLHPQSKALADMFTQVAAQTAQSGQPPSPELAMETATAVLFLEAAFADFQPGDGNFGARIAQLAQRLKAVLAGGAQQPLNPWMEELYSRVSDRQTMGTVVSELRVTLGDVEQRLDQYFRQPEDKTSLAAAPGLLMQMHGVLSVLGLDQAAHAVGRMREAVDGFIASGQDVQALKTSGSFERLGANLGALGFLVDMLGYQPVLAKKLFAYNAETGELKPLMGRTASEPGAVTQAAPAGIDLELQAHEEELAVGGEPAALPQAASAPASTDAGGGAGDAALPDIDFATFQPDTSASAPAPAPDFQPQAEAGSGQELGADDDLRDIFLEEAREVIAQGHAAVQALTDKPGDMEQQTALRRAFHTLKGSSRMVGLTE